MERRASPPFQSVRSTDLTRVPDGARFGPVVVIVSVTAVVPDPAAIVAGLNPQLVVPAGVGRFAHARLTVELKAAPPTGTAENV